MDHAGVPATACRQHRDLSPSCWRCVFVFSCSPRSFESLTLPVAVILIVPMCLIASIVGVVLRGQDNNILTQVGFIVLIGLAAKNAILIVEFAKQLEDQAATVSPPRSRQRGCGYAHFDDLARLIFGVSPIGVGGRRGRGAPADAWHHGVLGHDRRHDLRPDLTPVFLRVSRCS